MQHSDYCVTKKSSSLNNVFFDLIISGSIAAVESVKLIRALRRLGANVNAILTYSAKQFITETAIQWACGGENNNTIHNIDYHLSTHHALIIAPASANTIAKLNLGLADSPCSTLALSYLGSLRPIFILPNMHHSMYSAHILQQHINSLKKHRPITFLNPQKEEDKLKMPSVDLLANHIAHHYNKRALNKKVLITMGPTYEPIDHVRGISNLSTGKLGSLLAEELYRLGFETFIVCGPSHYKPRAYTKLYHAITGHEMSQIVDHIMSNKIDACVFSAAVSDYTPQTKYDGKIDSSHKKLTIHLEQSNKIIAKTTPSSGVKVGFKLQCAIADKDYLLLAEKYIKQYNLSQIIINDSTLLSTEKEHPAEIFEKQNGLLCKTSCTTKNEIVQSVAQHLIKTL